LNGSIADVLAGRTSARIVFDLQHDHTVQRNGVAAEVGAVR
jgi:hypothetical protein